MTSSIHVVLNAIPLRPGGGLTVLLGVIEGAASQADYDLEMTVICSADETRDAIELQGVASKVLQPIRNGSQLQRLIWTNWSAPSFVRSLNPDIFFSVNHFVDRIPVPQIVYHLSMLGFLPIDPEFGLIRKAAETIRNRSAARALQFAAANVFESAHIETMARKIHPHEQQLDGVIYIGLPGELVNLERSKKGESKTTSTSSQIFSITNHNPHKDNPTLIRAFARLVQLKPEVEWSLKIAGGLFPELWQPHMTLAKELGVYDRIEWLGFVSQADLTKLLQESLCLISTSRIESFCMVALESMARGCPAIVADTSSMPESVADAGVLVPPGDVDAFADAVVKFYMSEEYRNKFVQKGYNHIQRFTWANCGKKFADLFKETIRLS